MKNKDLTTLPNLDNWQTIIDRFEAQTDNTIIALDKFEITITDIVEEETNNLFVQNPKMPLSKVIASVLEGINENTPPPLLLKLTKTIIDLWLEQQNHKENKREMFELEFA